MEKTIRGRPLGKKNQESNTKYIVKYFDLDQKEWFEYTCSSYNHIKETLFEKHNYLTSINIIQNLALCRKLDKLLIINKLSKNDLDTVNNLT